MRDTVRPGRPGQGYREGTHTGGLDQARISNYHPHLSSPVYICNLQCTLHLQSPLPTQAPSRGSNPPERGWITEVQLAAACGAWSRG